MIRTSCSRLRLTREVLCGMTREQMSRPLAVVSKLPLVGGQTRHDE